MEKKKKSSLFQLWFLFKHFPSVCSSTDDSPAGSVDLSWISHLEEEPWRLKSLSITKRRTLRASSLSMVSVRTVSWCIKPVHQITLLCFRNCNVYSTAERYFKYLDCTEYTLSVNQLQWGRLNTSVVLYNSTALKTAATKKNTRYVIKYHIKLLLKAAWLSCSHNVKVPTTCGRSEGQSDGSSTPCRIQSSAIWFPHCVKESKLWLRGEIYIYKCM